MFVISGPIVDLRKEPRPLPTKDYTHCSLRLTQLLYNERVKLLEDHDDYYYVESLEQEHYSHKDGWHGYRGFVHKDEVTFQQEELSYTHVVAVPWTPFSGVHLSFGTYLQVDEKGYAHLQNGKQVPVQKEHLRPLHSPFCSKRLLQDTRHFVGCPYLWGGMGAFGDLYISSVDCSGLIYLLYRAQGILLPRDAHPQYLKGRKISKEDLNPGDLIYLTREENPSKVSHVLLYKNKTTFFEAPRTGEQIKQGKFGEDYIEEGALISLGKLPHRFRPHYISFL